MLKLVTLICFSLLAGCTTETFATNANVADNVAAKLDHVHFINFFFISRTEKYSLDNVKFKIESSINIHRECGNDCRQFMVKVVAHLSEAEPINCPIGQQSVLLEIGNSGHITYSYSGRVIKYEEKCYFNKNSIDNIIKRSSFIFD